MPDQHGALDRREVEVDESGRMEAHRERLADAVGDEAWIDWRRTDHGRSRPRLRLQTVRGVACRLWTTPTMTVTLATPLAVALSDVPSDGIKHR